MRSGQSKIESLIALALFVIAALGAWVLYGEEIRRTTRAMIQFFTGS